MFKFFSKKDENKIAGYIDVMTPMDGVVIDLTDVPDPVFSGKMVGDGFAIEPTNGVVLAPVSGEVVQIFPTNHAFGIRTEEGLEILVHVGIDTVQLKGEGFTPFIQTGDRVTQGQKVLEVDLSVLKNAGKSIVTPVVITNLTEVAHFECSQIGVLQTAPISALSVTMKQK